MKNLLLTLVLIFGSFSLFAGTVDITTVTDSSFNDCPVPVKKTLLIFGSTTGYPNNDTITITWYFGDGTDTVKKTVIWQNSFFDYVEHTYTQPGYYTVLAVAKASDGTTDSMFYSNVVVSDNCGSIQGRVYVDYDLNCSYGSGDQPVPQHRVILKLAGQEVDAVYTKQDGTYSFNAPSGNNYTVEIQPLSSVVISCPASGSHTVTSFPTTGLDFSVNCSGTGFDLYGNVLFGFAVPGVPTPLSLRIGNSSCLQTDGVAMVVLSDPRITYVVNSTSGAAIPDSINGDTLYFGFMDLDLFNHYDFHFMIKGDTTLQISDTVCLELNVLPIIGDLDPTNNNTVQCIGVRTSYDPNMKAVHPMGEGPDGRIKPNTDLTYTVFFQNTGTFMAFNIYILDTIDDQNLDMESLQVLEYSHPMDLYLIEDNILKFTFNSINLPDSNSNEPMSHGFVTYSIKQKPNLATGTIINNTAGIYFDYNPPVITNTTKSTIDPTVGVEEKAVSAEHQLKLYPNPAGDMVTVKVNGDFAEGTLYMVDITGKVIYRGPITNGQHISTKNLPNGLYNIVLESENKVLYQKLIVLH